MKNNIFPVEEAKKRKEYLLSLTEEQQREEIEKCKSFEYFYNNYCKIDDNMPDFSEKAYQEYLKLAEEAIYRIGWTRRGKALHMKEYPLTPNECYEK